MITTNYYTDMRVSENINIFHEFLLNFNHEVDLEKCNKPMFDYLQTVETPDSLSNWIHEIQYQGVPLHFDNSYDRVIFFEKRSTFFRDLITISKFINDEAYSLKRELYSGTFSLLSLNEPAYILKVQLFPTPSNYFIEFGSDQPKHISMMRNAICDLGSNVKRKWAKRHLDKFYEFKYWSSLIRKCPHMYSYSLLELTYDLDFHFDTHTLWAINSYGIESKEWSKRVRKLRLEMGKGETLQKMAVSNTDSQMKCVRALLDLKDEFGFTGSMTYDEAFKALYELKLPMNLINKETFDENFPNQPQTGDTPPYLSVTSKGGIEKLMDSIRKRSIKRRQASLNQARSMKYGHAEPQGGFLSDIATVKFSDDVKKVITGLEEKSDVIINFLTKLTDRHGKAFDNVGEMAATISKMEYNGTVKEIFREMKDEVLEDASNMGNEFFEHVASGVLLVVFISASVHYMYNGEETSLAIAILSGVGLLYYQGRNLYEGVYYLLDKISTGWNNRKANHPQADQSFGDDVFTSIFTLFAGYTSFVTNSHRPLDTRLFSFLGSFDRQKNSLKGLLKSSLTVLEACFNSIRVNVMKLKPLHFFNEHTEQLTKFRDDCDELWNRVANKDLPYTLENFADLKYIIKQGKDLLGCTNRSDPIGALNLLNGELAQLNKLKDKFISSNFGLEGMRQEAVGIMFRGGPGTGKSHSLNFFMKELAMRTMTASQIVEYRANPSVFMHNRQFENKFWDGYTEKAMFLIVDDFGQIKDMAGNPESEYMELIRSINSFPFHLHMAALDEKANCTFQSLYAFYTTNNSIFRPESINSVDAVWRRLDYTFDVCPRAEFCTDETKGLDIFNRKLDHSKLPRGVYNEADLNPTFLEYHLFSYSTNCANGLIYKSTHNWEEVTNMIYAMQVTKNRRYLQTVEQMKIPDYDVLNYPDFTAKQLLEPVADEAIQMEAVPQAAPTLGIVSSLVCVKESTSPLLRRLWCFPKAIREWMVWYLYHSSKDLPHVDLDARFDRFLAIMRKVRALPKPKRSLNIDDFDRFVQLPLCLLTYGDVFASAFTDVNDIKVMSLAENLANIPIKVPYVVGPDYHKVLQPGWDKVKHESLDDPDISNLLRHTSVLDRVSTWVNEYAFPITIVAGIVVSTGAVTFLATWFSGWFKSNSKEDTFCDYTFDDTEPHSVNAMGKTKGSKRINVRQVLKQNSKVYEPQSAAAYDPNGWNLVKKICRNNVYSLSTIDAVGRRVIKGYITALVGTTAILPFHFITMMCAQVVSDSERRNKILTITASPPSTYSFTMTVGEFLNCTQIIDSLTELDLALAILPTSFRLNANIIDKFPTLSDLEKVRGYTSVLVTPGPDQFHTYTVHAEKTFNIPVVFNVQDKSGDQNYEVRSGYSYSANTSKGDCGSLLCVMNKAVPKAKIFGFHIAGSDTMQIGHSSAVSYELLESAIKSIGMWDSGKYFDTIFEAQGAGDTHPIFQDTDFQFAHKSELVKRRSTRSRIIPSILIDKWGPRKKNPATLVRYSDKQGNFIDPLFKAIMRYSRPHVDIGDTISRVAADSYFQFLAKGPSFRKSLRRLLTIREAIFGIENEPDFKAVDRTTSLGFPMSIWAAKEGFPGKTVLLGSGPDFDIQHDTFYTFADEITDKIKKMEKFERQHFIYADTLKDELVAIRKTPVNNPDYDPDSIKTRLISGAPFDYTVIVRMYFGSFMTWFMKNRIVNGSAVGVNPYADWDLLARNLLSNAYPDEKAFGSGDYKFFDASHNKVVHCQIVDQINKWYGDSDENKAVRRVLWNEVMNSCHIVDDVIYYWDGKMPSGNPLTTPINTIYNQIAFRMSWIFLHDFDVGSLQLFDYYVKVIGLGDDNVFSVRHEKRQLFNEVSLCKAMEFFGLTYTTELKTKAVVPLRELKDVTFLKRGFRFCKIHRKWEAPLDIDTIMEIPYWTKDSHDQVEITMSNCDTSLRELSLHPKEVFEVKAHQIMGAVINSSLPHPFTSTDYFLLHSVVQDEEYQF